jgi:hypothetical protein
MAIKNPAHRFGKQGWKILGSLVQKLLLPADALIILGHLPGHAASTRYNDNTRDGSRQKSGSQCGIHETPPTMNLAAIRVKGNIHAFRRRD